MCHFYLKHFSGVKLITYLTLYCKYPHSTYPELDKRLKINLLSSVKFDAEIFWGQPRAVLTIRRLGACSLRGSCFCCPVMGTLENRVGRPPPYHGWYPTYRKIKGHSRVGLYPYSHGERSDLNLWTLNLGWGIPWEGWFYSIGIDCQDHCWLSVLIIGFCKRMDLPVSYIIGPDSTY
jgi:hypothetical protein